MSEQSNARTRRLANERDLYRYNRALARGDFETLTTILEIASQNAELERMIYAMHDLDQSAAAALSESLLDNISTSIAFPQARNNHVPKTKQESVPPRRGRVLFQAFAALLVTAVLITSSVLLFTAHRFASKPGINAGTTASTSTKTVVTAQGTIILLLANGEVQAERGGTGQHIWSYPTGRTVSTGGNAVYNALVVQNQVVYVAIQKTVYALREDNGKLLWQKNLPLPTQAGVVLGDGPSQLLVDSGIIYDDIAGEPAGVGYALRASDGKILWQVTTSAATTPVVAASNGIAYVAIEDANYQTVMQARRSSDGHVLWNYHSTGEVSFGTVVNNVFYVYAFPGAIPSGDSKLNKRLLAFNVSNGDIIWSHDVAYGNYTANIAYAQGTLIVPNGQQICVHSSDNGNLLWCTPDYDSSTDGTSIAGYMVGADRLYMVYLSSSLAPSATPCLPSDLQNCVFVQNLQLAALDYQTGYPQWTSKQFPYSADLFSLTLLQQKTLLFSSSSSQLTALDTSNGHQLWQINEPAHQSAIVTMITVA